jgi:predicted small secreted protein
MRVTRTLVVAAVLGAFVTAACHTHRNEGPAERAGEKIDSGLHKFGEKMEEGGQKLQDKASGD